MRIAAALAVSGLMACGDVASPSGSHAIYLTTPPPYTATVTITGQTDSSVTLSVVLNEPGMYQEFDGSASGIAGVLFDESTTTPGGKNVIASQGSTANRKGDNPVTVIGTFQLTKGTPKTISVIVQLCATSALDTGFGTRPVQFAPVAFSQTF